MVVVNGQTGQDNTANMAQVREAMALAQMQEVSDQVHQGSDLKHVVAFSYTSEEGKLYAGNLEFKKVNAKDLLRIGGLKSEYFREAGITDLNLVDPSVRLLGHILAHLKVVVVKSPEWLFNVDTIEDTDLLYEIYGTFKRWEDSFRPKISSVEEGNSEASEGTKTLDS